MKNWPYFILFVLLLSSVCRGNELICEALFNPRFHFQPNFGQFSRLSSRRDAEVFLLSSGGGSTVEIVVIHPHSKKKSIYVEKKFKGNGSFNRWTFRHLLKFENKVGVFRVVRVLGTRPLRLEYVPGRSIREIEADPKFPVDLKTKIVDKYLRAIAYLDQSWAKRHEVFVETIEPGEGEILPSVRIYRSDTLATLFFITPDVIVDARDLSLVIVNPI